MTPLNPTDVTAFQRRFRFRGGRVRGVRMRYGRDGTLTVELRLRVRPALRKLGEEPRPTTIVLRASGVDELRFQKRVSVSAGPIPDLQLGYSDGRFFIGLDTFALDSNDRPKVHDFRGADVYFAARRLEWAELRPNTPPTT